MAKQIINIGASPNDDNGDTIRAGGDKINDNFTELYSMSGADQRLVNTASPTAILTTDGTILFDSVAAVISIDLPLASVGRNRIPFKDIGGNSGVSNITINRVGSDTIVDSATGQISTVIASNGFSGYFLSDGSNTWYLF